MRRLILFNALLLCNVFFVYLYGVEIGLGKEPPRPRVEGETSMSSSRLMKSNLTTASSAYYPVSAFVDEVALTVSFTESVGLVNVMVYDADGQLVDMVTMDTNSSYEAVIATDAWGSGNYKLVVTYGFTTLQGYFNF